MRAWYRPKPHKWPPELIAALAVCAMAAGFYFMATHGAVGTGVFRSDAAPVCADAGWPCRGRAA